MFRHPYGPLWVPVVVWIVLACGVPTATHGQDSALNCFADGIDALDVKDYGAAAQCFQDALALEPGNREFRYHLGIAYSRMGQDRQAIEILERLIAEDPANYVKAYFDIAAVHAQRRNHRRAVAVLERARRDHPDNARLHVELGHAFKSAGDTAAAVASFERARQLEPSFTQQTFYDTAVAYLEGERFDAALENFQRVIELDPATAWADNARQALPQVRAAKRARKPLYLSATLGWGYDDSIPRDPLATINNPTGAVTDEGDQFQLLMLRGGYKHINRKDVEVGLGYGLFCQGYREATANNVMAHMPHAYLQVNREPFFFRLNYDFYYYYAGGDNDNAQDQGLYLTFGDGADDKLRVHSVMPTLTILEPHNLKSDISLQYQDKTYLDGVSPDADYWAAALVQHYQLPERSIGLRAGYRFAHENAKIAEATYSTHEGSLGCNIGLPHKVTADMALSYGRTAYDAFMGAGDRVDKTLTAAVNLTWPFHEQVTLQAGYTFTHNDSNTHSSPAAIQLGMDSDPNDFSKNVVLINVTAVF